MARNQSYGTLKFAGAAAAAILGGIGIGYLFGGAHPKPVEAPIQQPAPAVSTLAPPVSPSTIHPRATNADYTAPGAPRIAIHEDKTPTMRRVSEQSAPKPADAEASQEAAPPIRPPRHNRSSTPGEPAQTDTNTSGGAFIPSPPAPPDDTAPPPPPDDTSAPPSPPVATPPAPATPDPDFEHVNKHPNPQSGQNGAPKPQFRVQTGAYTDESNARSVADDLRGQGFNSSTRSEHEGDRMVYKVQVGSYRSKNGANKAAGDLQKKGYPAYISPMTP